MATGPGATWHHRAMAATERGADTPRMLHRLAPLGLAARLEEPGQGHGRVAGRCGLPLLEVDLLAFDLEPPAAVEDDVELVPVVRLLAVGLGGDEDVDADLEPRRSVDDLVAAACLGQPPLRRLDVERMHPRSVSRLGRADRRAASG